MPDLRHVLFVQSPHAMEQQRPVVDRILPERLGVTVHFASSPDDVTPGTPVEAVIAPTVAWLPEVLERLHGVQWIHFLSAGVEKIWSMDVDWSTYTITKSSGVHAAPMSEYALGAMLYFAKQFDRFTEQSRRTAWDRAWLDELTGRELVVLGMGGVGAAVAERARVFGMSVRGVARSARSDGTLGPIFGLEDLPVLLENADYVVVTLPLTAETAGLVGTSFFAALKTRAVLVDMSRGGVTSEAALIAALDDGTLRGAAIDVFETEPLPENSPLWNRPNVLLTPHVSGTTPHYLERALEIFLQNAAHIRSGETPTTPVDTTHGY